MTITDEQIDRLAELAKLEFNDEQREAIKSDMEKMLVFINKLNELDTDNVEPLIFMTEETNVLRADDAQLDVTQEEALKNAPHKDSDYFKIPKVLDK